MDDILLFYVVRQGFDHAQFIKGFEECYTAPLALEDGKVNTFLENKDRVLKAFQQYELEVNTILRNVEVKRKDRTLYGSCLLASSVRISQKSFDSEFWKFEIPIEM